MRLFMFIKTLQNHESRGLYDVSMSYFWVHIGFWNPRSFFCGNCSNQYQEKNLEEMHDTVGPKIYARARKQSWLNERKLKDEQERM